MNTDFRATLYCYHLVCIFNFVMSVYLFGRSAVEVILGCAEDDSLLHYGMLMK